MKNEFHQESLFCNKRNHDLKETNLQTSISYNQVALVDKTPTELGLLDCIKIYVEHNINCIVREAEFDLNKAKDKLEIIQGLLKALEDLGYTGYNDILEGQEVTFRDIKWKYNKSHSKSVNSDKDLLLIIFWYKGDSFDSILQNI